MTGEQAFELIGVRAKELSNDETVKKQCLEMQENGATLQEIESFVFRLAIATLCGKGE